jgi:RNA polymerase sigma-70 factor (ECF subfamily)
MKTSIPLAQQGGWPMLSPSEVEIDFLADTELVRRAQHGDTLAFQRLAHRYDETILRLALQLTGSEQDAQYIYEEAFLRAYQALPQFRFESSFFIWIYRVVSGLCLDYLRRKNNHHAERELSQLTPRERLVFELKQHHGLRLQTVAVIIGTSEDLAKNILCRAIQKLRLSPRDQH